MKNPCKDCLVKPMCFAIACDKLNKFINSLIEQKILVRHEYVPVWIAEYEVRPRVLEYAKQHGIGCIKKDEKSM